MSPHKLDVMVQTLGYLRSNFPQEIKDLFDVADAFLPATGDLLPPHLGSNVEMSKPDASQQFITLV